MLTTLVAVCALAADPVSTQSLLKELADPLAIARFPDPPFRMLQSSSYDRATTTPDDAKGWFANHDAGNFLRVDERDGRSESVLLDTKGPGAVVRIWSPNPKGTMRIYLDGAATPAIEAPMAELLDGTTFFGDATKGFPLAGSRSRGWNLFVPIPFAKRCVITTDDGKGVYYQVNWREYSNEVEVLPFKRQDVPPSAAGAMPTSDSAAWRKGYGVSGPPSRLGPGGRLVLWQSRGGVSQVIREIRLIDQSKTAADRSTLVLECTFDGTKTVSCPLADLLGIADQGSHGDSRRAIEVAARESPQFDAAIRWPMPFREGAAVELLNVGSTTVELYIQVEATPWTWDDRSMHFHATWKRDPKLPTRPMRDFRFVTIDGKGVYAGDSIHVVNPVDAWWGEGDEKIYVDGETFPSHIGTGTEDYYGYGWCCPELFAHPLHSQSECDGHADGTNFGRTIVSRLRGLDAIPFEKGLRFDMEIWHWAECEMAYAATTFWYARPGATCDVVTDMEEVKRGRIDPPPVHRIDGALECEKLKVATKSDGLPTENQGLRSFGTAGFSSGRHLWVKGRQPGDFVEFVIPADGAAPQRITLYATNSWDYGIVQCAVNGIDVGGPIDLYSGEMGKVVPSGPIDLGTHAPANGELRLRVTVVGGNERSAGSRSFFGLDAITLSPAK